MKKLMVSLLLAAGCVNYQGCNNPNNNQNPTTEPTPAQTTEVKTNGPVEYLCVGMESSKRFGSCPGCKLDATRMDAMFKDKFGYKGTLLISKDATKSAVVSKLKAGIESTPENGMFMFCYSGHGGQESLGGKEPDGSDRQDEYLCLYDTYMLDDEIWEIISKCKGRVFLYFDACHSATMYRSIKSDKNAKEGVAVAMAADDLVYSTGFRFRLGNYVQGQAMSTDGKKAAIPSMLCWSGCKEYEYSYGGSTGGVMTSALVSKWKKGITYKNLWALVEKAVRKEQPTQHPVATNIGAGFPDAAEAFK